MAVKLTWDKSSSAYEAVEKAISKNKLYFNCDMLVRIMIKYSWESDDEYVTSNEILTYDESGEVATWEYDWWEGQQDVWVIAAAPIEEIELQDTKAWDKFKEKINQLQTYKLFQNDKETYLSKQDIIDLVSEIEREENANEEKEVIENKLKEIENNEQIHRNS